MAQRFCCGANCRRRRPSLPIAGPAAKLPIMSSLERILVPTDMSGFAELALRYALYFNETLGSRITLMHAETMRLYPDQPFGYYFENAADARLDAAVRL